MPSNLKAGEGVVVAQARYSREAGDHQRRPALASLRRQAGPERRLPHGQGGRQPAADLRAAGRRLHRPRRVRACERGQAGAGRPRAGARGVRDSGRRASRRGPRRQRQDPARADFVRRLQGQPVRTERAAAAGDQRLDRRRRAGARGHLLHPVEVRRRQRGGPLRHPRAGRQAHRHHRHASRGADHVQAGQPPRRRGARQHRLGGDFAGRRHHRGIRRARFPA